MKQFLEYIRYWIAFLAVTGVASWSLMSTFPAVFGSSHSVLGWIFYPLIGISGVMWYMFPITIPLIVATYFLLHYLLKLFHKQVSPRSFFLISLVVVHIAYILSLALISNLGVELL